MFSTRFGRFPNVSDDFVFSSKNSVKLKTRTKFKNPKTVSSRYWPEVSKTTSSYKIRRKLRDEIVFEKMPQISGGSLPPRGGAAGPNRGGPDAVPLYIRWPKFHQQRMRNEGARVWTDRQTHTHTDRRTVRK